MSRETTQLSQGSDLDCNLVDGYQRPWPGHGTTLALGSSRDMGQVGDPSVAERWGLEAVGEVSCGQTTVGFEYQTRELRFGDVGQCHDNWPLSISSLQARYVWLT